MSIVESTHKAAVRNLVEIFLHAPRRENNHLCSARAQPHERARKNTPKDDEKGKGPLLASSAAGSSIQANTASLPFWQEVWTVFQTGISEIPAYICCEVVIVHGSALVSTVQSLSLTLC